MKLTRRHSILGLTAIVSAGPLPPPSARAANPEQPALTHELARIEASVSGRLGVAVHDTHTGRRLHYRADERFPLCSTFKVLACAALLARVDAGEDALSRRVPFTAADLVTYSPVTKDRVGPGMTLAELCEAGLTESDNTAGNLILASLGGPPTVTAFARRLGDTATRLDRTETTLNDATPGDPRDTTTPGAMAVNLQALILGNTLSPASRGQLAAWLLACQTGAAKLRAGLPPTWRIGDKTGGGDWGTTNDVAVAWPPNRAPMFMSVYLTNTAASFNARNAALAAVAQAVERWIAA